MFWLPVVERELRAAARRRSTYRVRLLALFAVVAVFAWTVLILQRDSLTSGNGQRLFGALATPVAFFAIFIGMFATSDSISFEKREGTLGLLFLTDLKGYDIVFGKLVASSLNGFYAVIAVLPILGLPLLEGGVTMLQFVMMMVALLTAVTFSLAIGILVSTFSKDDRQAAFFTFILLGLTALAPVGPSIFVWQSVTGPASGGDYFVIIVSVLITWLAIILALRWASAEAPHCWKEPEPVANLTQPASPHLFLDSPLVPKPAPVENLPLPPSADSTTSFPTSIYGGWRHPRISIHPYAWLALRGEPKRKLTWFFVLTLSGIWCFSALLGMDQYNGNIMLDVEAFVPTFSIVNTFMKIWIAAEASRRFVEDRRINGFELLLATPLNDRQILAGQWLALKEQFGGPMLALIAGETTLGLWLSTHGRQHSLSQWILTAAALLVFDAIALGWAGIWAGMISKGRIRAIVVSTLLIMAIPWAAAYVWTSATTFSTTSFGVYELHGEFMRRMTSHKLVIGLAVDVMVIGCLWPYLLKNFRRMATERLAQQTD